MTDAIGSDQDPPCPWDERAAENAAAIGHLELVRWLRAQEPACPCDWRQVLHIAEIYGHLEVAKWLCEQGAP